MVQLTGNTHDEQRPGVFEHPFAGRLVECVRHCAPFFPKHQQGSNRAEKVDVEHESHVERELFVVDAEGIQPQSRQHDEIEQVERDVQQDIDDFQRGKLDGLVLIAQIGKGNRHKGIDGHGDVHHSHILRMVGIAYSRCYRMNEAQHQQRREEGGDEDHREGRGVDLLRILTLFAHKAEEGGLHTERQQDDQDRDVGIDVGDDAILTTRSRETRRLDRHQQVVDEAGDNAREAVDGRVLCEGFQICHNYPKNK